MEFVYTTYYYTCTLGRHVVYVTVSQGRLQAIKHAHLPAYLTPNVPYRLHWYSFGKRLSETLPSSRPLFGEVLYPGGGKDATFGTRSVRQSLPLARVEENPRIPVAEGWDGWEDLSNLHALR